MAEKVCTKEKPDATARVHPDAKLLYEEYNGLGGGGDYERWECPHCGERFYVELPD